MNVDLDGYRGMNDNGVNLCRSILDWIEIIWNFGFRPWIGLKNKHFKV